MTDDTASERVERWTVDRPDYCCPNCGGSDIGPLTVHAGDYVGVHAGDYVGVYWCPDCSCEIPEPPQVEVIPVAPLLRWLDDLIEEDGYAASASLAFRDKLEGKLTTLREAVEACAEALGAWEMSSKPSDPTIAQGLLRAGDKARRALASLDEQGGSDE